MSLIAFLRRLFGLKPRSHDQIVSVFHKVQRELAETAEHEYHQAEKLGAQIAEMTKQKTAAHTHIGACQNTCKKLAGLFGEPV